MVCRLGLTTGALWRTSLYLLSSALVIVKLFSAHFATIGVVYAVTGLIMLLVSIFRGRRLTHDFADQNWPSTRASNSQATGRLWGRDFRTAGDSVLLISALSFALEIIVIVLLGRL